MLVEALRASAADQDADDQLGKQRSGYQAKDDRDRVKELSNDDFPGTWQKGIKVGISRQQ